MPFFNNPDLVILQSEFEQSDFPVFHELRCDCPTAHTAKLLLYVADVLNNLYNTYPVLSHLGLNGDNVMTAALVEPDIEFIDLDLPDTVNGRPEMVLEAIGREAKERVDQTVVTDDCQQSLLVIERVLPD